VVTLSGGDDKGSNSAGSGGGNPQVQVPPPNGGGGGEDAGSGGASGSAKALAEATVQIIEQQDTSAVDALACSSSAASQLKRELGKLDGASVSASVSGVDESGSTAQARIAMKINGSTQNITLEMSKKNGKWCASGI
jgi:hypothetical protein